MQLIDTHTHVHFPGFDHERVEILQRARQDSVLMVTIGTQFNTSESALKCALENEDIFATVGLHPTHTHGTEFDPNEHYEPLLEESFDFEKYKALALNPKVVGIGECGLDYYRFPEDILEREKFKEIQKKNFKLQIELAKSLSKALVIHCRPSAGTSDAYLDLFKVLDECNVPGVIPFVVHSYTGNLDIAKEVVARDGFLGINGILTFDKTGVLANVVQNVPLENIVLETDAPYLAPKPFRGKRNEPSYVKYVAEEVARLTEKNIESVSLTTTNSAKKLFSI